MTSQLCKPYTGELFYYAFVNYTFTTSGIREIITLSSSSDAHLSIALYKGEFHPGDSCSNFYNYLANLILIYGMFIFFFFFFSSCLLSSVPFSFLLFSQPFLSLFPSLRLFLLFMSSFHSFLLHY